MKGFARFLTISVATLAMMCGFVLNAQAGVPADAADFQARLATEAKTPEGAATLWMDGALLYSNAETRDLGRQILMALTDELPPDFEKSVAHASLVNKLKENPEIMRSYCEGAKPENGYKATVATCEIAVAGSKAADYVDDEWVVKFKSSGASSNRPVKLVKRGDIWKVYSYSSIYSGVAPAKK